MSLSPCAAKVFSVALLSLSMTVTASAQNSKQAKAKGEAIF